MISAALRAGATFGYGRGARPSPWCGSSPSRGSTATRWICSGVAAGGEALDLHPEDPGRVRDGFVGGVRELDAPRLAAATGVHLGLHHDLAAQALRDRAHLVRRVRDGVGRDRNAVAPEQLARLIFVQVHCGARVIVVPASPRNAASPCASSAMTARSPPARTKAAAASTLGRMLPAPSSFPASKWSACATSRRRIGS